jgi:8-hydroxy-5-deazaflavin:NADPH oxidoreductase
MKIAVLGTGPVGQSVATRLDELGHEVTVGTRDSPHRTVRLRLHFSGAANQPPSPTSQPARQPAVRIPQPDGPCHIWVAAEASVSAAESLAALWLGAKLGAIRSGPRLS